MQTKYKQLYTMYTIHVSLVQCDAPDIHIWKCVCSAKHCTSSAYFQNRFIKIVFHWRLWNGTIKELLVKGEAGEKRDFLWHFSVKFIKCRFSLIKFLYPAAVSTFVKPTHATWISGCIQILCYPTRLNISFFAFLGAL